jgi:AraC family transcriptional regulator
MIYSEVQSLITIPIPMNNAAFTLEQTHGMLRRPDAFIHQSSDAHEWHLLYASVQRELPFESHYPAVPHHLIVLSRSGPIAMDWCIDGKDRSGLVGDGGVFFLPAGSTFGVHLAKPLESIHLYLRANVVEEVMAEMAPGFSAHRGLKPRLGQPDPTLAQLCMTVTSSLKDDPHSTGLLADHLAHAIAARLVAQQTSKMPSPAIGQPRQGLDKYRLARVFEYIEDNLNQTVELAQLAALCNLSVTRFSHQFRLATGAPPYRYVLERRCERARFLLKSQKLTLVDVAGQCGFCNQEHLTRHFRRYTGITPRMYRRRL